MTCKNMRKTFRGALKLLDQVHMVAALLAVFALFALILMIVANVALRTAGTSGIRGIIEINEILIACVAYLVIGVTQRERQHITITAATAFLRKGIQDRVLRLGLGITLLYVALAAWESTILAGQSYAAGEARWGLISVPIWPGRIVVAFGYFSLAIELCRQVIVGERLLPLVTNGAHPASNDPASDNRLSSD